MCGIAGVFGRQDDALVRAMLSRLGHRGPDDQHIESGPGYTLGATRLAILDLETGRQPLISTSGRVVASQNGEIYDYLELREELAARGHTFQTKGDTEVIAAGYEAWGEDLPRRLVGMFACALFDRRGSLGLLARDRVGKKPLYYHVGPCGELYYASEIKCLLEVPSVQREIDPLALDLYLSLKHVPGPLTIWRDVRELPPAHRLCWSAASRTLRIERYYQLSWAPRPDLPRGPALDQAIRDGLDRAVRRRLRSDVPMGFFLSGGIDSSLVVALAAQASTQPIHTFTLTYGADSSTPAKEEDRACARLVAERYGTIHVEESIEAGSLAEDLPKVLAHFDQPFAGVISTFYLARRIARDVKVALAGDGADEAFGSYLTHRLAALLALGGRASPAQLQAFKVYPDLYARSRGRPEATWRGEVTVFSQAEKASLLRPELRSEGVDQAARYFEELYARATAADPLNRVLEVEFQSQLPDQVLAFVDRLSMASSLEVRCPFLDQDLLELVAAIPAGDKITADGEVKAALKRAAAPYLPERILRRPKEGFLMPVNAWLQGSLEPWVRETLSPAALGRSEVFQPGLVAGLLERFYAGEAALGTRVLALLAYQTFHDLYLEDDGAAASAAACPGTQGTRALA